MPRFLTLAVAVIAMNACTISTPPRSSPNPPFPVSIQNEKTPLLVFSHGHHTGLVLPRKAFQNELPEMMSHLTGEWLEFGWGDEGFYRSEIVTFPLAFRALAYPTPGVMHIATSNRPLHIDYAYSPSHLFHLTKKQEQILVQRLVSQFARDEEGNLISLGPGRYGVSQFYRSRDRFHYPSTCNAWTSNHLRSIGIKVRATTAPGLFRDLEKLTPKNSTNN